MLSIYKVFELKYIITISNSNYQKKLSLFFKYILFSLNGWKQKLEGQAVNQNYSADLPCISYIM